MIVTNSLLLQAIDNLAGFLIKDLQIGKDFREFSQVEFKNISQEELRNRTLNYVYSRRVQNKSVLEFYLEKNTSIPASELQVIYAMKNAFSGVFQIKKLTHNGFELYSLINEKLYNVNTVESRNSYKGAYVGAFLYSCLFKIDEEYYVCDARAITGNDKEGGACRYAVTKIIENPSLVYFDNPDKLSEIKNQINIFDKKFHECFGTDEVITTNKFADVLINSFNDYCESGNEEIFDIVAKGISQPNKLRYFPTKDFNFSTEDFAKKSIAGFSSQGSEYDVGIIFVKDFGLFAIPFYSTFCQIFQNEDYTKIENYTDCLTNFLNNDKIPRVIIAMIASKYSNFTETVNKILNENYSFDEILNIYKPNKINDKSIATASILYSSKVFAQIMQIESQKSLTENSDNNTKKVGRNELCPCGSGKKYKKCCGQ